MPLTRAYPINHYPVSFYTALVKAVELPNIWHTACVCPNAQQSAIEHRRLRAMLRGFTDFPGQNEKLRKAVETKRISVRKEWIWQLKEIRLQVRFQTRPSEDAEGYLEARYKVLVEKNLKAIEEKD